jgi:hypothetical protein
MKLKNKISGEIKEFSLFDGNELQGGATLESLTKEWEDAPEEPKKYWYISDGGDVYGFSDYYLGSEIEEAHREISNLFETREEAELAVRKLKAWKRLKDSKIKFCLDFVMNKIVFTYVIGKNTTVDAVDAERQIFEDMKIVFGGEE